MFKSVVRTPVPCRSTCQQRFKSASRAPKGKARDEVNQMTIQQAIPYLRASEAAYNTKTLHLAIRLKCAKSSIPIRGSIALPRLLPSKAKVAVFARDKDAEAAREAGAYIVGAEDLVKRVSEGKIDFDKCLSTPECLPLLAKLARTLGPKGLMPSAKRGTVTKNIANAILNADKNLDFRQRSGDVVRMPVAQTTFSDEEIAQNIVAIVKKVTELGKPKEDNGIGASTIDQIVFSSTHGPGIPLVLEAKI